AWLLGERGGRRDEHHHRQRQGAPAPGPAPGSRARAGAAPVKRRPEERVAAYVERILARRRPPRFKATEEELEAIAAAAALATAQPGADLPDPRFVERLGRRLRAEPN